MRKTNITKARRLFNEGVTIYLLPPRVSFVNPYYYPVRISNTDSEVDFDWVIDAYRGYFDRTNRLTYWYDNGSNG